VPEEDSKLLDHEPEDLDLGTGDCPMPLRAILDTLREASGAANAVFLRLVGSGQRDVFVASRHVVGDVAPEVRVWLHDHATVSDLGWSAAELLPVDEPRLRSMPVGGRRWSTAGGLVADGGIVLGWLAVSPNPSGSPARRRLVAAWRAAADAICARRSPAQPSELRAATLVYDADGVPRQSCPDARPWRALPGLDAAIRLRVVTFLRSSRQVQRLGIIQGAVRMQRLDGPTGPVALVCLAGHRALTIPVLDTLSPRQVDVCLLASGGATAAEIGASLHVGEETVRSHLKAAYRRLEVANRFELVRLFQKPWPGRP
jgi:DNA-binding CsgD family transcriptional regulator